MSGGMVRSRETSAVPRIAMSRVTANDSNVPTKVSARTRTGMASQPGSRVGEVVWIRVFKCSSTALVQNGKFKTRVGGKQFRDFAQAFGQSRGSEQRVVAFAQVVVVDVEIEREEINGDGVGKRCFQVFGLVALGVGTAGGGEFAGFEGIERCFPADAGFDLAPGQFTEIVRDTGALDQRVSDVDVELEGDGKLVVHQAGGDEDALRIAKIQVAMADRIVAESDVVPIGDQRVIALADCERDEVVSLAFEGGSDAGRNGRDHALEVKRIHRNLAGAGVADAVRSLRNGSVPNHLGGATRYSGGCLRHYSLFYTEWFPILEPAAGSGEK